tara:strand:+ start:2888 stop:3148 length:261 start_codon:yes stop_codon:yes gene_type:complete
LFRAQRDKVNKKNIYIPKKTIFEKKNDIGIVRRPKNIMKLARLWYLRYMMIHSPYQSFDEKVYLQSFYEVSHEAMILSFLLPLEPT